MPYFLIYTALFTVAALAKSRLKPDATEFYIRGRSASAPAVAFSLLAACVGGSATIGMIDLAASAGTPAFWWLGSGCFGFFFLSILLAKKIRASRSFTMPEILANILGPHFRVCSSLIILASCFAILAAQLSALSLIISSLCQLASFPATLLGAGALLLYTIIGGQAAVMRSDIWQFLILLLSLCVLLYFICQIPDANRAIADIKIEIVNDKFGLSRLCYFLFIIGSGYLIGPTLFVSLLSARSSRAAANGALLAAPCLAATAALITILGIGCGALAQTGTAASNVLANVLNNNIPSWAKILTSLGLYSAIISSADSCLMTAAAVCANDIFRRPDPFFARVAMLAITVGALLLATQGQSILALLLMAYDIFVCGIVAPVFVGILFPGNAKKSRGWFFAAMICGSSLGFASAFSGNYLFSMAGLMIALFLSFFGVYTRKRGIYSST